MTMSEVYYGQQVEEESSRSAMRSSIRRDCGNVAGKFSPIFEEAV
jgi:hypothetical protein